MSTLVLERDHLAASATTSDGSSSYTAGRSTPPAARPRQPRPAPATSSATTRLVVLELDEQGARDRLRGVLPLSAAPRSSPATACRESAIKDYRSPARNATTRPGCTTSGTATTSRGSGGGSSRPGRAGRRPQPLPVRPRQPGRQPRPGRAADPGASRRSRRFPSRAYTPSSGRCGTACARSRGPRSAARSSSSTRSRAPLTMPLP